MCIDGLSVVVKICKTGCRKELDNDMIIDLFSI